MQPLGLTFNLYVIKLSIIYTWPLDCSKRTCILLPVIKTKTHLHKAMFCASCLGIAESSALYLHSRFHKKLKELLYKVYSATFKFSTMTDVNCLLGCYVLLVMLRHVRK